MSSSVLYRAASLDGYIAGPNDTVDNRGGDGFMRLPEWFVTSGGEFFRPHGPAGELYDQLFDDYGSVVAGRRTVEQVDHGGGEHRGRAIFVPSHLPPGASVANYALVTYVLDGIQHVPSAVVPRLGLERKLVEVLP